MTPDVPHGMEVVVGAAMIRAGRVLGARRTTPLSLAGRWEFPGGKVEPGESEPDALRRELREELSCDASVGAVVGRAALGARRELIVYACTVGPEEPQAGSDHDLLRWFAADELADVDWLEADRALLADVARLLA